MVFANCPGRGAHALRPYSRVAPLQKCLYYLLQIIKEMVLGLINEEYHSILQSLKPRSLLFAILPIVPKHLQIYQN